MNRLVLVGSALLIGFSGAAWSAEPSPSNPSPWETFLKFYPPRAIAAREEGAVGFKVSLDSKGLVAGCEVTHSSGYPRLDDETCQIIALHAQFKPDPNISSSQVRTHEGLIAWKLPTSSAALAAPKPVEASGLDKVICRKSVRTGTIGGIERTCMTKREWGKQADELRQPWEELQGRKGVTNGR
jgi:TonB family protein